MSSYTSRRKLHQSVTHRLFLDIINFPERRLDDLYDANGVSATKAQQYYRMEHGTTPGRFRKRYNKPSFTAVDHYTIPASVELTQAWNSKTLLSGDASWKVHSDDDEVVRVVVKRIRLETPDSDSTVDAFAVLNDGRPEAVMLDQGRKSLEIAYRSRGKLSSISVRPTDFPHGPTVPVNYRVHLDLEVEVIGYAVKSRFQCLETAPDYPTLTVEATAPLSLKDTSYRCIYTLDLGQTRYVLGLDEQLIKEEVDKLDPAWTRVVLTNEVRRELRSKFGEGQVRVLPTREGIRLQRRLCGALEALETRPYYTARIGKVEYYFELTAQCDLSEFASLDPYLKAGPLHKRPAEMATLSSRHGYVRVTYDRLVEKVKVDHHVQGVA